MNSILSLSPYSLYEDRESGILITSGSISKVKPEIKGILEKLKTDFKQTISQMDYDSIELLKNYKIIYEKRCSKQFFDGFDEPRSFKPIVNSDDEFIAKALNEWLEDTLTFKDDTVNLYISIHCSYSPQEVSKLYKELTANDFVKTCYILGGNLIIDNLFSPSKGIPCHFCLKWHQSEFNTPLDLFSANAKIENAPLASFKVKDYNRSIIVNALINNLSNLFFKKRMFSNNWLTTTIVDLISGNIEKDTPLTSSNCSCQKV